MLTSNSVPHNHTTNTVCKNGSNRIPHASQLEIGVGRIQMNFIHLLSTEAVQHIIIHCLNTPIWAAGPSLQPSTRAVSFKAWTGEKIQAGDLLEPLIPRDDCWVSTVTVITYCYISQCSTQFFDLQCLHVSLKKPEEKQEIIAAIAHLKDLLVVFFHSPHTETKTIINCLCSWLMSPSSLTWNTIKKTSPRHTTPLGLFFMSGVSLVMPFYSF